MKSFKKSLILLCGAVVFAGVLPVLSSCRSAAVVSEHNTVYRFSAVDDGTSIHLKADGKNILSYYHAVHDVPAGVDPLYRRSGFIHPLLSPEGKVLTRIQPSDHYHHYGIWGPWTLTHIEGREVDFWNLKKGQGTVRFAGVESILIDEASSGFRVRQEHVDFTADKAGRVSIAEILEVQARLDEAEGRPVWVIDLVSRQKNVLNSPIVLDAYRYGGGLGFRSSEEWTQDNCTVLTSEGKARNDADGTRARWCDVNGGFNDGTKAGIVFLSHPANREHPEPMRVWPENVGPNGTMFFEFCPIRLSSWTFQPQQEYVLRYQMIVYDGNLKPDTVETLWKKFAQPPIPAGK